MTKIGFLLALRDRLSNLKEAEVEERLAFYSEMIEDRMEEGLSEEEAVDAIGSVDEIAAAIIAEVPLLRRVTEKIKPKRRFAGWELALIIIGSPIWLSLLIAAFAVAFALYASLWAVLISLWAGFVALAVCLPAGCAVAILLFCLGQTGAGFALLGASVACAGLAGFFYRGCRILTRLTLEFSFRIFGKGGNFTTHGWAKNKKWLTLAVALLLLGCVIFAGAMMALNWDFTKLTTSKYETNEYEIHESFTDISVISDSADIRFLPATDGVCRVVSYERKNARHGVSVKEGALSVSLSDGRKWYEYIFNFGRDTVTVYLPKSEYAALAVTVKTGSVELPCDFGFASADISTSTGSITARAAVAGLLKLKTGTGSICVEDATVGALNLAVSTGGISVKGVVSSGAVDIRVSTGRATLSDLTCTDIRSEGSTGDILLTDVVASGIMRIKRSTGDVRFERADASEIFVETDTGDVAGSLLSAKTFRANSTTGRTEVPRDTVGGKCEITTSTGDIRITVIE